MRSKRIQSDGTAISLFPFLAVLLCTIGALVVVLVVFSRQVRASAIEAHRATQAKAKAADPKLDKIRQEREGLDWQIELMVESREKTAAQLIDNRLILSNLEEQIRRSQEKIRALDEVANELSRSRSLSDQQRAAAEADLAKLRQRVAETQAEIDRARTAQRERPRSYAIIPYEGPNKTQRRPVFIECTAEAVILQPEGIRLSKADFEEPLGPGNPLASALRAAREYYARGGSGQIENDPYPLLLVRPSGITAYYDVREAIKSWDSDFGYELIGEEWKLEFPRADERLAEIERQAILQGREYQMRLAASAPSKYAGRRKPAYRAAPHRGGIIHENGTGGEGALGGGSAGRAPDRVAAAAAANAARSGGQSNARVAASQAASGGAKQAGKGASSGGTGQSGSNAGAAAQDATQFDTAGQRRGENWALPDATASAVAVTRSVRVVCRDDRFIIMSERGQVGGRTIMLKPNTNESIDEFVSALWEHMKSWGIAGNGLFWRPILVLQVGAGGEQRARDLANLLDNSGVELREVPQP